MHYARLSVAKTQHNSRKTNAKVMKRSKEKVSCSELPELAETVPLDTPLARFGESVSDGF
jgi:hypothetical protein